MPRYGLYGRAEAPMSVGVGIRAKRVAWQRLSTYGAVRRTSGRIGSHR